METVPAPDTLAIPPDLLAELQAIADEQHRPAGDVLRELVEQALSARRWRAHAEREDRRARELGILDDGDGQPMTDAHRRTIREKIAQGLASARQGRLVDGEAVFARIKSEMAALEQQGRR